VCTFGIHSFLTRTDACHYAYYHYYYYRQQAWSTQEVTRVLLVAAVIVWGHHLRLLLVLDCHHGNSRYPSPLHQAFPPSIQKEDHQPSPHHQPITITSVSIPQVRRNNAHTEIMMMMINRFSPSSSPPPVCYLLLQAMVVVPILVVAVPFNAAIPPLVV